MGVTAGNSESLRFVNRIPAIDFCIVKDPSGTISRAWVAFEKIRKICLI